jgi:hypothetical protein|tara:strand:- start:430 stop:675 length:246 start_codon:yes stop_codon:yes gene_type:complete
MIAKAASKLFKKKKKKKSKKKAPKKKTVLGGAQTLAGKALINPVTLGGGAAFGIGRASGRSSEKAKTNKLNEALRRRGVRV